MSDFLVLSKDIVTTYPYALRTNNGEPWDNYAQLKAKADEDLIAIPKCFTAVFKQSTGEPVEYWNPLYADQFVVKYPKSTETIASITGESAYVIKASDWNLTKGEMQQDANNHYSDTQYDQMYQNGIGISNAIKYAYTQGFSKVILEKGTYCFCASMKTGVSDRLNFPQIFLNDLSDFTFDLGGSTLKLCVDDTQYGKYYLSHTRPTFMQKGDIIGTFYCRNLTICNGVMIGDRFTRVYTSARALDGSDYKNPSDNEDTFGIIIFGGCKNIYINHIEFREFMGDGITGLPVYCYDGINNADEVTKNNNNISYDRIGPATRCDYITENLTVNDKVHDCAITTFFDTYNLYKNNLSFYNNRVKDKDNRVFMLNFPLGYTKMPSCYPLEIYILTYETNNSTAKPLRRIRTSYLHSFKLTEKERYIRLMFIHETELFDAYDETKSYVWGNKISKEVNDVLLEFECTESLNDQDMQKAADIRTPDKSEKWRMTKVSGVGGTATYDSAKKYIQGSKVTFNIGTGTVCYSCKVGSTTGSFKASDWNFISTERLCYPTITHDVAVFEFIGSDTYVTNCSFINSHRGGISNLPHNSVVDSCIFSKHYTKPGDGFKAPNPGNNFEGNGKEWSTIYHIDIEDWYSQHFKLKNCRFEPNGLGSAKVLIMCLSTEVSGCTGFAGLEIKSSTCADIHDNIFDYLGFSTMLNAGVDPTLTYSRTTACRYIPKTINFLNNRILSGQWRIYHHEGQILKISGNTIYDDFFIAGLDGGMFKNCISDIFANNTLIANHEIDATGAITITIPGYSTQGTVIDTKKSNGNIALFSPMCGDMKVTCHSLSFCESLETRVFKRIDVDVNERIDILASTDPNGTAKKVIRFYDCIFNSTNANNSLLNIIGINKSASQQFEIYFDRCIFITPTYNKDIINYLSGYTSGDKINLYFDGCDFTSNYAVLCNKPGCFEVKKFFNCTSNKALTCNGNAIS